MRTFIIFLALIQGFNGISQFVSEKSDEWQNYDALAEYLSREGGKWIGENSQYDSTNERSPKAFGLWFNRPLSVMLTLKIVAYVQDTVLVSSQGTFNWHPIKQEVFHAMSDRGNGYSDGITSFPNDSSFVSIMKIYRLDGNVYDHRDDNFIINENEHRNTSFKRNAAGEWEKIGSWIWKRELN